MNLRKHLGAAIVLVELHLLSGCASIVTEPVVEQNVTPAVLQVRNAVTEDDAWTVARTSNEVNVLIEFLNRFPQGKYWQSAQLRLKLIQRGAIQ